MKKMKIALLGLIIAVSFMCCKKDNGPGFQKVPSKDTATHPHGDTSTRPGADTSTVSIPFDSTDQIKITASQVDSSDSASLVFSAETIDSYLCPNNSLSFLFTSDTAGYTINYTGVGKGTNCNGRSTASSVFYINQLTGTKRLTIIFNGITYSGTITKTVDKFTINWLYSFGVTISPTTL